MTPLKKYHYQYVIIVNGKDEFVTDDYSKAWAKSKEYGISPMTRSIADWSVILKEVE